MDETRTEELEQRIAELESRLNRGARGERRESMETAFWALMHNVFPEETRRHMKAAGREQLLAARTYLDHLIARLDEPQPQQSTPERETIEVE
ncbi:MAG TPA: hypothetical protein VHK63_08045 [Candidatus Limnocylindria bacterium]|nr:hypothetical protein [Candidatus Limnocylindria bacterium]